MGRRSIKPAAAAPSVTDDEQDVDEFPLSGETADLWEDDEDDDLDEAIDEDHEQAEVVEEEEEEQPNAAPAVAVISVEEQFEALTIANLPARMRLRPLADQSNEWLLATIGRLADEIPGVVDETTHDLLEIDLLSLHDAAIQREIAESLDPKTYMFIAGVESRLDDRADDTAAPSGEDGASLQVTYVERESIHPDPLQPRQNADADLRDSIRSSGILQPITVRRVDRQNADIAERAAPCSHCARTWKEIAAAGEYVIVDGERRWQGAEGVLETLPVIVRADQGDTYDRLKTQLVANSGKPLTPIEEARTFARMLEDRDVGIAALARDVGRPASTVNDRVKLLELGPWLSWIESGSVSISMAIEHLVPLRGIPDQFHEQAIAEMIGTGKLGDDLFSDVNDFGTQVIHAYGKFMYPLTKSKSDYDKQPEFATKNHDEECACGGIAWGGYGAQKGRKHCGNPDWWKPLQSEAKKKAREKAKAEGADEPATKTKANALRIELPAGVATVKSDGYRAPAGVVLLTDTEGRWRCCENAHHAVDGFDPAELVIDDKKLVRVKSSYGLDKVGTKDLAAVKAARAAWVERFRPAADKAAAKLVQEFTKLGDTYGVAGGGVHTLLAIFDVSDREYAEAAQLLGIAVPKGLATDGFQRTKAALDWFGKTLARGDAERLVSFLTFLSANDKRQLPSAQILVEQREAIEEIQKKRAPWATTKAPKKAGAK